MSQFKKYAFIIIFQLFCLSFCLTQVKAKTYFVDNTLGMDTYNGLSADINTSINQGPWKTIQKVNSLACGSGEGQLNSGDNIYFKKGEVWREQLIIPCSGSVENSISFGAYGTGENPIIDGSMVITNWSKYNDNIYVADVDYPVERIFVDNNSTTISHYPNQDYEIITSDSTDHRSISSSSFNPPESDLVGAGLSIKIYPWTIEDKIIASYDSTNRIIGLTDATINPISANYGFFITNKLWMIDMPGEWAYDPVNKKVYMRFEVNLNPTDHVITTSTPWSTGIKANNKNYFMVRDIDIRNTGLDAIEFDSVKNVVLQGLKITLAGRYGIHIYGESDFLDINHNLLHKTKNTAIKLYQLASSAVIVADNVITDTGILGIPVNSLAGIYLENSTNAQILRNTVSDSAYIGIRMEGTNNLLQNNYIHHSCLLLDDCGGIYSGWYDGTGNHINSNIITDSIGNFSGTPLHNTNAHGIYIDLGTNNMNISGNTIANTDRGIFIHVSSNNTVTDNLTYNSRVSGLSIMEDSYVNSGTVKNNTVLHNTFFNNSYIHPSALFEGFLGSVAFGSYNNNKYFGTYYGFPISQQVLDLKNDYSLTDWNATTGQDTLSSDIGSFFQAAKIEAYTGNDVINNGRFDNDISGWSTYSSDNSAFVSWVNSCGLDNGCLHIKTQVPNSLLISNLFKVQPKMLYEIAFSITSTKQLTGNAIVRLGSAPWTDYMVKPLAFENGKRDISVTFKTDENRDLMFNIDTNSADYNIDNVSIRPVTLHDHSRDSSIYFNTLQHDVTINLAEIDYCDTDNNVVSGGITLAPFTAKVLLHCFNNQDGVCNNRESHTSSPLDCQDIIPTLRPSPISKLGDANNDGFINIFDFSIMMNHFGTFGQTPSEGDFNLDEVVDGLDQLTFLNLFDN